MNSAGVRRQLVAQTRGAASLDIRERTLDSVLIPRDLISGDLVEEIVRNTESLVKLRSRLDVMVERQRELVDSAFGAEHEFRPDVALR